MGRKQFDIAPSLLTCLGRIALYSVLDSRQTIPNVVIGIAIGDAELQTLEPFFADSSALILG